MACSCNARRTNEPRETAADRAKREQAARAQTATTHAQGTPPVRQGQLQSQTFALQTRDGMVRYGSKLERDAAAIRLGGTPA